MNSDNGRVLQVSDLSVHFHTFSGVARAVENVSFHLERGETLGLVGESGCGKSVTAMTVMRLIPEPPGRVASGRAMFGEVDLLGLSPSAMRDIRGDRISMIFQEPMSSLNPVFTIGDQIGELFRQHRGLGKRESLERAVEMLRLVQIPAPERRVREYPHQLSGGMRQRAMIAMALALNPEILIADEPTTALDVTIQAQILELMVELKEKFHAAILMITHDLGVIAEVARRVVVMYAGQVVEEAPVETVFHDPRHPYTRGLLRSIPKLGRRAAVGRQRLQEIPGIVPSLYDRLPGCAFQPRCLDRLDRCAREAPPLFGLATGHQARCWLCE